MKTVLVGLFWLFIPPMTIVVLDDSCTAVQEYRGSGRSPVVILTQELVKGRKMLTAGKAVLWEHLWSYHCISSSCLTSRLSVTQQFTLPTPYDLSTVIFIVDAKTYLPTSLHPQMNLLCG